MGAIQKDFHGSIIRAAFPISSFQYGVHVDTSIGAIRNHQSQQGHGSLHICFR